MRQIILLLALWLAAAVQAATYTPAEVPDVHRADRTVFVANPDGVLSPQATERLNAMLGQMRKLLTVEPMVVVVDNIDSPSDPSEFATELFELWGLGKDDLDNGFLMLVVKDQRAVQMRTGYGLEGALPDITLGRILRQEFYPAAREGDFDRAALNSMAVVNDILSDPDLAAEYRSKDADADEASAVDDADPFLIYVVSACALAVAMLILLLVFVWRVKDKSDYDKYKELSPLKSIYLVLTAAGLFIPLIASVPLILWLNRWRNKPRNCPHCHARMNKVDEVHDNDYLTPAQDLEERIGSVDYDVWLCPDCGETDILAYTLPSSTYIECDNCHARTMRPVGYRVVTRPTARTKGLAVKEYECLNCHHRRHDRIELPPDNSEAIANAAAAAAILGGLSGGRSSGGGFSGPIGGGFGGGHTGGGGAGGHW